MPPPSMKQYTDEELVRLYVDTQQNAYFELLYVRYADRVYRKCLSFTKDPMRAEDLTHDIFLKLVTKLSAFKQNSAFATWLYSITYNYCTDQVRSTRRRAEVFMDDDLESLEVSDDDGLAELAEMEAGQMQKALQHLAPEEQTLLLLKYQDDVSIRDIASVQNMTESAVKMRLKRSRDKLRRHYLEGAVFWLLLVAKAVLAMRWSFH